MKKTVKVTALSLALAFTSSLAMAAENIAVINADYLFFNHPDHQATVKLIEDEFRPTVEKLTASKKQIDQKVEAARKKIEAKVAALQKDSPKLRAAEIKKREDEIKKLEEAEQAELNKIMIAHDTEVKKYEEAYAKREQEEGQKIFNSIAEAIKTVATQKKYTIVLNQNAVAFTADQTKLINDEVLKAIPAKQAK